MQKEEKVNYENKINSQEEENYKTHNSLQLTHGEKGTEIE